MNKDKDISRRDAENAEKTLRNKTIYYSCDSIFD